jgi:hypothetical protein
MHELPARDPVQDAVAADASSALAAVAGDRVAGDDDPPELFDVAVDQLAGSAALIAVGREAVRSSVCEAGATGFIVSRGFGLRSGS